MVQVLILNFFPHDGAVEQYFFNFNSNPNPNFDSNFNSNPNPNDRVVLNFDHVNDIFSGKNDAV